MATLLKQSTAVDVAFGPAVDQTDGFTPETAITYTPTILRVKKNGGNWAAKNQSSNATHEENGWYEVNLDATDTNTLGILILAATGVGAALPIWREFLVVPASYFESVFSTGIFDVNVIRWASASVNALIGGRMDSDIGAKTGNVALSTQEKADVNAEIVDALATDTYAEPGQGAPAATATITNKINYLYKFLRNKLTQDATDLKVFADDGTTVDHKATVSDDGTTYTRGEIVSGP